MEGKNYYKNAVPTSTYSLYHSNFFTPHAIRELSHNTSMQTNFKNVSFPISETSGWQHFPEAPAQFEGRAKSGQHFPQATRGHQP